MNGQRSQCGLLLRQGYSAGYNPAMRLAKLIPQPVKPFVRSCYLSTIELADRLPPRRNNLYPPRQLDFIGGGTTYEAESKEFLKYFIDIGELKPHETVLDVGCGIGRMAAPLTNYLTGNYEGFDIVAIGIRWSNNHIARQYPNFRFQQANVHNRIYNPKGTCKASEYSFPYPDASFDFVFLTSVFTHMLPEDISRYLREIVRVLKPHGRALITYFLLNDESKSLIKGGASHRHFVPYLPQCWTHDEKNPEVALAYAEQYIKDAHKKVNLPIEAIHYGSWPGRSDYLSYQDITISRKIV
ncbi:MAG TPA: class I SAM-dependent methyltransferase [Blastocatellia bacterium]|nr:class I SAM-dependent methyltransferase [Blastocatellia bacterium]